MGYFIKDIANETKYPAKVSLSNNPNFIQFESKESVQKPVDISLTVKGSGYILIEWGDPVITKNISAFKITEIKTGESVTLIGTTIIEDINDFTFYLGEMQEIGAPPINEPFVAQNIMDCLLKHDFFRSNFNITIPPIVNNLGTIQPGYTIYIKSKGGGKDYAFKIEPENPEFYTDFITLTGDPEDTTNSDTIEGEYENVNIVLDLYSNTGVFLGEDDTPNPTNIGSHIANLSKLYFQKPIWFNVNVNKENAHYLNFDNLFDWFDPDTITDYRFSAKRFVDTDDQQLNEVFYYSNILYMVNGYTRGLNINDLKEFVYDTESNNIVKPLTNQPELYHIKGQTQFFNFILSDKDHSMDLGANEYNFGITYRLYTQSKQLIGNVVRHEKNRKFFDIVNSIGLNIDEVIESNNSSKEVGIIEVYLCKSNNMSNEPTFISEPITFNILPDCLYKVNDFAFLNSLGGWSTFNFAGSDSTDFKADSETFIRTHIPDMNIHSDIESIQHKTVLEQFIVQTMPIDRNTCEWLKELSASTAVYELKSGRYVIVDTLNIKPNSNDDLFTLEMRYSYSDTFNNIMS